MAALAPNATEMARTAVTELELREKAGHAEDEPELYRHFQTFIADAEDFAEKVRAIETSPELTPVGMAARIKTFAERHVLTAETLDREAEKLERRQAISKDEAWTKEIALPSSNNLLAVLPIMEARRELETMSDINQDLLLRDPGPQGHLARRAAFGLVGLRLRAWGLPGTEAAARAGVVERADVHLAGFRALELRGLARRYRVMVGIAEPPQMLGTNGA